MYVYVVTKSVDSARELENFLCVDKRADLHVCVHNVSIRERWLERIEHKKARE